MNKAWEEFQATLPEPMRSNIEQASRSITREAFEFAWQAALRQQQGEQQTHNVEDSPEYKLGFEAGKAAK